MLGLNIPAEMISMLGGSMLGMVKSYMTAKSEATKMQHEMYMQRTELDHKVRMDLIEGPKRGWKQFAWTRRTIALTVVFSVVLLPKMVAMFFDIPIVYGYNEVNDGILFFPGSNIQHWSVIHGLVISPADSHILAAVAGLYFGGSSK